MYSDYLNNRLVIDKGNQTNLEYLVIEGLFNKYSVSIYLDNQANIFIGENGLGKTTVLSCIHLILVNDYFKLSRVQFSKICVKFKNDNKTYEVSKLDINEYLKKDKKKGYYFNYYTPNDVVLKEYAYDLMDHWRINNLENNTELFELLVNELSKKSGMSYRDTKKYIDIHLRDWFYEDEIAKENKKGRSNNVSELKKAIDNNIKQRVIYLPTYRRIENDFEELHFEGKSINRSEMLIRFGMSDVQSSIDKILDEIRSLAMKGFTEMTGVLLKEYADGHSIWDVDNHTPLTYETVKIVLDRVGKEIENSYKDKILDLVKDEKIYENPYLYGLLIRLINTYELQRVYDDRIKSFADTCNTYLIDKRINYNPSTLSLDILMDNDEDGNEIIGLNQLSSGEKQIVSLFSKLYLESNEKSIVIIDEPELSLSIQWQKNLLPDIIRSGNCDLLVTATHSPFVFENEFDFNAKEMRRYITKYRRGISDGNK